MKPTPQPRHGSDTSEVFDLDGAASEGGRHAAPFARRDGTWVGRLVAVGSVVGACALVSAMEAAGDPADAAARAGDFLRPLRQALLLQRVRNLIRLGENTALRRALERDPLTGIFNRHTFLKRTAKMLYGASYDHCQWHGWTVIQFDPTE